MSIYKITTLISTLAVVTSLTACQKQPENQASTSATTEIKTLSIGYQKAALKLIVAQKNKIFEQEFPNTKIEWKEFPAGPQTLEALSVGAIDVGYTGDTPVIFARAAGKAVNYLGYEKSSQFAHALLVGVNSPIKNIQDLKGKRIALTKGSSAHNFLSELLKKAGLTWSDIQPIWLSPADARAALDKQSVDAWAIWDPYASAAEIQGNARVLIDSKDLPQAYSFYLSSPQFLQAHASEANKIIAGLNKADEWINAHPDQTAQILADSTGLDIKVTQRVIDKKPKPATVSYLSADVIQAQQQIADFFYNAKLIPQPVKIKDAVWEGK
ncbi:aliphatic sulfonate ABC transporter substrate-binding protein [Acinetobacter sp. MD2(2019)]|uniref:aliphatic sulfonate ABC transporter substrate-binding protein n=1 Tax=Acinetobacter sp. MD2(2019) TaxID=2605273 RepID=UPI002D1E654C|nr:aliphatic sulfonate ABC transporter substrate-binding protein [Acinetobacter sp. MD2(2019)]MEB3754489.1 aliphatic sulfonate ABC transporter substrate-binding protein [Acinetobacter sp. MD2(2019)]